MRSMPSDYFGCGLSFSDHCGQAARDLIAALRKIFRDVVKNLRAVVRGGLRPARSLVRRFDRVANVFAIAQRRFAQKTAIRGAHFHAVAGVGTRLLAADVELHRAVDGRRRRIGIVG